MNTVTIDKKNYQVPASWAEINDEQLQKVAHLIFGLPETLITRQGIAITILIPSLKKIWTDLTEDQAWDLIRLTGWIFDDISGRSIIREFEHEKIKYHLPEDNLRKESIIAFSFADNYFDQFVQTKDAQYLDKVIACIARQAGSAEYPALQSVEGDIREHFSTSRTAERAKAFATLDPGIKTAILLFFMGSKKYIHKQYAVLFQKPDLEAEKKAPEKPSFGKKIIPKPDYGWLGIIYDLAEQKTFGPFDQVKHQFLHTCCYYLTKKKYEHEEQTTT